jgi:hypothetical protein
MKRTLYELTIWEPVFLTGQIRKLFTTAKFAKAYAEKDFRDKIEWKGNTADMGRVEYTVKQVTVVR